MQRSKRCTFFRWLFYLVGCVFLACGIILNTKTGLGVSPLVSLSFCVSQIWGYNFSFMTFILYAIFCVLQFPVRKKKPTLKDPILLQIPFSIGFTLLMNLISKSLPTIETVPGKAFGLVLAILCTGLGVTFMVNMHLIPNPADGLADAIGDATGKTIGFGKNIMDATSVALTLIIGLAVTGHIVGVGIGTVAAAIFTGRVFALGSILLKKRIQSIAGIS